jgi:hypothetical protein
MIFSVRAVQSSRYGEGSRTEPLTVIACGRR